MENKKIHKRFLSRKLRHWVVAPILWIGVIPLFILDIFLEIYVHTCFLLWKLPLFKRKDYIRIDRHKLKYLTFFEKIGCVYCGYSNGLANYFMAIAGRSEMYWCGIRHKKYDGFMEPLPHTDFTEYGNEKAFRKKYR